MKPWKGVCGLFYIGVKGLALTVYIEKQQNMQQEQQNKSSFSYPKMEKPKRLTSKAEWEDGYFGSLNDRDQQSIMQRAALSKLPDLRQMVLPSGDIEVRLWCGFGMALLQGFVLKRIGGQWTAIYLESALPRYAATNYTKAMPAPRSGWERLWNRLVKEGLLTLPDASTLKKDNQHFIHGLSYIVEINRAKTYRTYMYNNPEYRRWPEARHILTIFNTLYQEFGFQG